MSWSSSDSMRVYRASDEPGGLKTQDHTNASETTFSFAHYRDDNFDVKNEVDRMYANILKAIEGTSVSGSVNNPATSRNFAREECEEFFHYRNRTGEGNDQYTTAVRCQAPLCINATTHSRVAAMQALLKTSGGPSSLFRQNTFGSGRKGMSDPPKKSDAPGPGSYNAHLANDEDSLIPRRSSSRSGDRPSTSREFRRVSSKRGTANQKANKVKGVSFGKSERSTALSIAQNGHVIIGSGVRGGDGRPTASSARQPAPGDYNISSIFDQKKPTSIKGSFGQAKREAGDPKPISPGPGSYAIDSLAKKTEAAVTHVLSSIAADGSSSRTGSTMQIRGFNSSSPRLPTLKSHSPGPGAYRDDIANQFRTISHKGYSFGKSATEHNQSIMKKEDAYEGNILNRHRVSPGPGEYSVEYADKNGFSVKGSIPQAGRDGGVWGGKNRTLSPGPGEYHTELPKKEGVSFKFRYRQKTEENPGPGQYDTVPPSGTIDCSGPKWSLYGRPPERPKEITPGPADYDVYPSDDYAAGGTLINSGVSFPKSERQLHQLKTADMPGPGTYDVMLPTTGNHSIGKFSSAPARVDDIIQKYKSLSPGPGTYDGFSPWTEKATLSPTLNTNSPRFTETITLSPGPGYYDCNAGEEAIKPTSHRVLFGVSERNTSDVNGRKGSNPSVGPGSYNPSPLNTGVAVNIGLPIKKSSDYVDSSSPNVGPGAYDVIQAERVILPNAPRTVFSSEKRILSDKIHDIPGPGAYDESTYTWMYDNSAGVSIGKAVRPIAIEDREAQERTNVGPGAYDPKDQNKMLGLGAVVPLATRFIIDEKNTKEACEKPGPGTYDVPAIGINTSKGVSIPIVGHSMMYPLSVSPGPGEYDTGSTLDPNKGPTIGGEAQRSSAFIDGPGKDAPGPGAYDPSLSAVEPNPRAHTILGKSVSTDVGNINVGPGSYDPQEMLRNYTQSFSHAPRIFDQITGSEVPGPGWYAVNHRPIDPKSYETFIGKQTRFDQAEEKKQNDGPGPGYYDSTSPGDKDVRTFSMGTSAAQRPEIIGQPNRDAVNIPGPGQYDLALEWIRDAKFTIHALDRFISHQKVSLDAPGPGYYAIPSFIGQNTSKAPTIGTKSTKESGFLGVDKVGAETSTPSPGPGTYDPYNTMRKLADAPGPSFSFSLAKKYGLDSKTHLYPGPGAYNVTLPKLNGNGVSFSVAGRKDPNVSGGLGPGPGAYNIDTAKDLIMENQPSFTFPGKSYLPEGREKNEVPGPGAYDSAAAEEYLKTSPGYSFGKAQAPVSHYSLTSNAPGPGSYDTHLKNDSPAFSFGRDKKSDEKENHGKNCSPGPGEYNTMLSPEGPFYSISGKFQDPTERHETCVPGPGAYNIADMSGPYVNENVHAHYFTKSERFPTVKEDEQIPGPGAYLSHITKDGALIQGVRSVSFPSAARIPRDLKEDTPGPGMYDTNVQLLGPFWSITGKPLEAHSGMNRVGPGEYNLSNTPWIDPSKGVGFMRANRFPESESDAPGPGQYDVSLQWIDPRKGHLFTTSDRTDEVQSREAKSMPGPGEYHLVNVQNGPYWTIKGKPAEMNPSNDVPGPGAYNLTSRLDLPSAPSATIALAEPPRERELQQAASAPGPGTYRIPGTLSPLGTIIGKEVRYTNGLDPIPGPGTYDTTGRHLFGDHAAKYSFPKAERNTIDQHTMDTPGPGMYDGHLGKDTILPKDPVHTIPQTDRGYIPVSATGSYGGPGAYNLGAPPYGGPVWSVPSGPRTKIGSDNGVPGVGVYNIPNRWSGNGPTISGKWKDKAVEGSPGPGEYRVQDYDPYRRDMATIIDFSKGSERVINTNIGTGSGPVYYSPSYYNPPL